MRDRLVLKFQPKVPGKVMLIIEKKGNLVFKSESDEKPGSLEWDGKFKGKTVRDGLYSARLVLSSGGVERVIKRSVRIDTDPPKIITLRRDIKNVSFSPPPKKIGFALSEAGRGSVWIFRVINRSGSLWPVRMIGPFPLRAGINEVIWDLKNSKGSRVGAGPYLAAFSVRDLAGNASGIDYTKLPKSSADFSRGSFTLLGLVK